jgi:hypothetical protein
MEGGDLCMYVGRWESRNGGKEYACRFLSHALTPVDRIAWKAVMSNNEPGSGSGISNEFSSYIPKKKLKVQKRGGKIHT